MHPVSTRVAAASEPYHGVYLGAEHNGTRMAYVYARGECVHKEPIRVDALDDECERLAVWLDRAYPSRPHLAVVR